MFERLDRLASAERAVVEAVSVWATQATSDVLEAVCGDADVPARLAGVAAGLLIEEPVIGEGGGVLAYRTSHPLLAEAAYSRLPELTRRRSTRWSPLPPSRSWWRSCTRSRSTCCRPPGSPATTHAPRCRNRTRAEDEARGGPARLGRSRGHLRKDAEDTRGGCHATEPACTHE